jgi:short-subunit dehydrogenase involved in D-alanine esterification of teichoic acids
MSDLERSATVTGASRGLGLELACGLARASLAVVVDARAASRLNGAVAGLPNATALEGDVSDGAHRRALVPAARAHDALGLLVNNAH